MKIIITMIVAMFVSFNVNGQINRYDPKKINSTVKTPSTAKLPVLKATKYVKMPKGDVSMFDTSIKTVTQLDLAPGAYSNYSSALNETFDVSNLRAKNANLVVIGYHDGNKMSIAKKSRRLTESMSLDFKSKKDKSYRIKVNFFANFDDSKCKFLVTEISSTGSSAMASFKIKKGLNQIDFIVQTPFSSSERVFIFNHHNTNACKEDNYEFTINNVSIRQLED